MQNNINAELYLINQRIKESLRIVDDLKALAARYTPNTCFQWVDVNDRLPPPMKMVLLSANEFLALGFIKNDGEWQYFSVLPRELRFWCELPEVPTECQLREIKNNAK